MDKIDYLLDAVGWLSAAIGQKDENKRVADLAKANRALRQAKEIKTEVEHQNITTRRTVLSLNELSLSLHKANKDAGWWNDIDYYNSNYVIATKFALIHSEISEAFEAFRKGAMDAHLPTRSGVEVEISDALIRIFDLAGFLELDLDGSLLEKGEYNKTRLDHSLEARAASGGKKF